MYTRKSDTLHLESMLRSFRVLGMKITMTCFSQTGNTVRVAKSMAQVFQAAGHAVDLLPMMGARPQAAAQGDLLAIGAPCFSSRAPTPVRNFLAELPYLNKRRAFVFATCGGAPGRILYDLASGLRKRDADIIGAFLARGEVHHPAPALVGRFPGRPNVDDLAQAEMFAQEVLELVTRPQPEPTPVGRREAIRPGRGFYDLVAPVITDRSKRLFLPKPKADKQACDGCQRCVMECPTENITMHPYPRIGGRCIRCYRCLNCCPQKAIHANWRVRNLTVRALYNTAFVRRFGDVEPGESIY